MSFFNKKEEVMDIKLTQFGKDLLSRGAFKPVFYQFFDDDILYNSEFMGVSEDQNVSEARILEQTPKMKTQALTLSVEKRFEIEQNMIDEGSRQIFNPIKRDADPYVQERILLYPLGTFNVSTQELPRFSLYNFGEKMEDGVSDHELTEYGILKNIPQLSLSASFRLKENRSDLLDEPSMINTEAFFDLSSREVSFADGSRLEVYGHPIIIDLEELNVFFGSDNFELEIYEVTKRSEDKVLNRVTDLNEINRLFHIKTDSNVEEVEAKTGRKSNYYRSREN
jgi:hypothetical protein